MKKLLSLLLVLVTLTLPVLAAEALPQERLKPRLVDEGQLLTEKEEKKLLKKLDRLSDKTRFDIVILTMPSLEQEEIMAFADNYFDDNGFGYDETFDGILMVVSADPRNYWISSTGCGLEVTTEWGLDYLDIYFLKHLKKDRYYKAFDAFAEKSALLGEAAKEGDPYNDDHWPPSPGSWILLFFWYLFLSLILMTIVGFVLLARNKKVKGSAYAADYLVPGSLRITDQADSFSHITTDTIVHTKENDSRSGRNSGSVTQRHEDHTSASGRQHGGGGGTY